MGKGFALLCVAYPTADSLIQVRAGGGGRGRAVRSWQHARKWWQAAHASRPCWPTVR
jgi:hypothetical protein